MRPSFSIHAGRQELAVAVSSPCSCIVALAMIHLLPMPAEPRHFALGERFLFVALAGVSVYGFWRRFGPILGRILASKKDSDFHSVPYRETSARLRMGGFAAGQGDSRATACGPGSCTRLLGFLRLRAGDSQPLRGDSRSWLSRSRGTRGANLLLCCGCVRRGLRGRHRRALCAEIFCPAQMAGRSSRGSRA